MQPKVHTTVRLPPEIREWLEAEAWSQSSLGNRISPSDVIRNIIEAAMQAKTATKTQPE